ncbi:MAG: cation-translocating P-type ATPase [Acidimicrobiales bacterium]
MGRGVVMGAAAAAGAGLTDEAAAQQLARDGPNRLPAPAEPPLAARALHHAVEPLSLVLIAAALASIFVLAHTVEGLTIAAIVLLNVSVSTVQEGRAASAIAALDDLTAPTARVVRNGRSTVLAAADLVRGDLVEVTAGDRVPADVVLVEAASLAVDEALLTGESFPADKRAAVHEPGGPAPTDRTGEAFAGTLVVRGHGMGIVTHTGAFTELGAIASTLQTNEDPPLVRDLRQVAARMSVLAVAVGGALIPVVLLRSRSEPDAVVVAVLAGVALAVAAIPEGLASIVVTALALGARRMADGGAIVRRLEAIETVGSAQLICTDKTGTITTGRLAVADVVTVPGREAELWRTAAYCNDARDGTGDPLDVVLLEAAEARGFTRQGADRLDERPFDADTLCMVTIDLVDGAHRLSIKGAPEVVLARCEPGPDVDLLASHVAGLTARGMRVIALATAPTGDPDATALDPVGLVALHDPLRPSALDAVASCRDAGIRVVLVTGDHASTAEAIAASVGIEGAVVEGRDLSGLDPEDRAARLREAGIVARVDPVTKLDLVQAHRSVGRVVAMTGDGVNDAPALRAADVGLAIAGEGGTDVARAAADIVVTNGDLGTIVRAVGEGRRIHRNLRSVVGYLVTGNISEVLIVIAAVVLLPDLAVPLLPVQLLWVNLVTDGLPAVALGVDRPGVDPLRLPSAPTRASLLDAGRLRTLVERGAIVATAVLAAGLVASAVGWDDERVRSQLLLALLAAHLVLAYAARATERTLEPGWWRNRTLAVAVGGSLLLQVLVFCTQVGREALGLATLPPLAWALAALAAVASLVGIDVARTRRRHGPA